MSTQHSNLIELNIPAADVTEIENALTVLETKLKPHLSSLTVEQRSFLNKMGKREQLVREAIIGAQQNAEHLAASIGTADAVADLQSLDKYRPIFQRVTTLAEAVDDTEMAIGIDLIDFARRVYGQLKLSAPDSLKDLLESLGKFFVGGRRAAAPAAPAK